MPATTLLRDVWNGCPEDLGERWTLRKRTHVAVCRLWSHEFGWELRLEVGELFRTHVCRSTHEIFDIQEAWKAAMIEKGWAGDSRSVGVGGSGVRDCV
jgi:hypothetical protein